MPRALIKLIASLALALGLAFVVAPATSANAATATAVQANPTAQRATVCSGQRTWVTRSHRRVNAANKAVRRATHNHKAPHHAKLVRAAKKRQRKARNEYNRARRALASCIAHNKQQSTSTPITMSSPIQALCDAGVPQTICDQLAGLPDLAGLLPAGAAPTSLPLDQLCAQVPGAEPLCEAIAAGGGVPDISSLSSVLTTVLDAVGLGDLLGTLGLGDLTGGLGGLV